MSLSDRFITRPVLTSVCSLVIFLFGCLSIGELPIEFIPNVASPQIVVTAGYPGGNAEFVEQSLTLQLEEILSDKLSYKNEKYQLVFNEFLEGLEKGLVLNEQHFVQNPNLTSLVADLTTSQNILSENWKNKHQINTKIESDRLKQAAEESVFIFKLRVTENLILEKQQALKEIDSNESNESIIKEIKELTKVRNIFANELGIIVTQ